MFKTEIVVSEEIKLVKPDIERDAVLGNKWLEGEVGKTTMNLMGNPDFTGTTIEEERDRVKGFIESTDSVNWSLAFNGQVVGSIWLDRKMGESSEENWWLSIMIGDTSNRGKGLGIKSSTAVIEWAFKDAGIESLYARHITKNHISRKLLTELGFVEDGGATKDGKNIWQNYLLLKQDWQRREV